MSHQPASESSSSELPEKEPPQKPGAGDSSPPESGRNKTCLIIVSILGVLAVICLGICGIFAAFMVPAYSTAREAASRAQSANNLKQIGRGILYYHDNYNQLPAPVTVDENGTPRHSWRIAILPFCDQTAVPKDLFPKAAPENSSARPSNTTPTIPSPAYSVRKKTFPMVVHQHADFHRPWNESPNSELNKIEIPYFSSPLDSDSPATNTSYVLICDPESAFPPDRETKLFYVKDGMKNTMIVIEVRDSGINWMDPRDFNIDEAIQSIKSSEEPVNVLMLDGSVHSISPDISADQLRAMMTADGGETVLPF